MGKDGACGPDKDYAPDTHHPFWNDIPAYGGQGLAKTTEMCIIAKERSDCGNLVPASASVLTTSYPAIKEAIAICRGL